MDRWIDSDNAFNPLITSSSVGKYFRVTHGSIPNDISENFSVLKKCKNKFDCLLAEMFLIKEMKPSLNVQSDSIRAKVFI